MDELITFIARSLVDQADQVRVSVDDEDARETRIELCVAPDDLGKVIGRQGRTARAIRTLLSAAAQKERRRYFLDIVD